MKHLTSLVEISVFAGTKRLLKRMLSAVVILQLIFTGWVATSHMAVASHGSQQHAHIHFDVQDNQHSHSHESHSHQSNSLLNDSDPQTEHSCEIHIPLSYLDAPELFFKNQVIHTGSITAMLSPMSTRHLKPLLPPPNH